MIHLSGSFANVVSFVAAAAVVPANIIGIVTDNDTGNFYSRLSQKRVKNIYLGFINENVCPIAFVRDGAE